MISTTSLSEACHELFARYPLAARPPDCGGTVRTMLLMLRDSDGAKFFVLSHERRQDKNTYSLRAQRTTNVVNIDASRSATVPKVVVDAVMHGVPIPRDGSLFGWRCGNAVTALIPIYTMFTPQSPEPFLAVMPRANIPETDWPPFTNDGNFGQWFWEHCWAGRIISVHSLIAGASSTVFWANTQAIFGSNCCLVAHDVSSADGYKLPQGAYVYYRVLQAGKTIPPLDVLLAVSGKTDLALRFRPRTALREPQEDN
jgi:hypothetical protein